MVDKVNSDVSSLKVLLLLHYILSISKQMSKYKINISNMRPHLITWKIMTITNESSGAKLRYKHV